MKNIIKLFVLFTLFISSYAFAGDENPVTGAIQDDINITINSNRWEIYSNNSLYITFCEPRKNNCYSPMRPLKIAGNKTDAVKIEPTIEGEWRFSGDYGLQFTPKSHWKSGTEYKISFLPNLFPSHVNLATKEYKFITQHLYLSSKTIDYLQDPSDPNKKLVTAKLEFNYPIDKDSLKNALSFTLEGSNKKLPFTIDFSEEVKVANITIPVEKLEKSAQFLDMNIAQSVKTADNSGTLTKTPNIKIENNEFAARVTLPSLYDYLSISNPEAKVIKNASYIPEQLLLFESNAPISPQDLSKFLEIKLLPKDKPVTGLSSKKDYQWTSSNEVSSELRTTLPDVKFVPQSSENEASNLNAFILNAEENGGQYLLIKVKKGLPANGGYELGKDYEYIAQVPELTKEVKIMAQGAILSLSGEKTLSVISLGVENLKYTISRVKENNLNHLISQTRGDFANPKFSNYEIDANNISQIFNEERKLENVDDKKPNYSSFDFSKYLKGAKGLFFLDIEGTNAEGKGETTTIAKNTGKKHKHSHSSTTSVHDSRFLLITDLGIIVKKNLDGTRDIFVQSISENKPVKKVDIEVLGLNGDPVATARTDSD
ncbi:MAG: hypothetical protein WCJ33_06215, partial [Pseudomonadota bacterium]